MNLPVLLTSAYHPSAAQDAARANLLQKPGWEHEIATALRSAIGGP